MPNEPGPMLPGRIVVLGVPGSRRVSSFVEEASRLGIDRVDVVSYLDLIAGVVPVPGAGSLVRVESPSESAETTRAILKAGIGPLEEVGGRPSSSAEVDRLDCGRGEIVAPRQWFFGFHEVLARVESAWSGDGSRWVSRPSTIATTFDKLACLDLWRSAGLPTPGRHPDVQSYAQLRDSIPGRHARVFVKLRYGYSAMGAVALEWRDHLVRAITTTERVRAEGRDRLFVSKRPRVLTSEPEIAALIDALAFESIVVEDWLPKARYDGVPYDVRVVMIGGRARHLVGRASFSPFTNLNLDARRIPRESVEAHLGDAWGDFEGVCERAASHLPEAGVLGLDVLIRPGRRRFALLEANAFGDYLPRLMHAGQSVYEAELAHFEGTVAGALA